MLAGEIPWEIGNLYSLETLAAQHMRLTGPIPPSIFNISSLKEISLHNNSLYGNPLMNIWQPFLTYIVNFNIKEIIIES